MNANTIRNATRLLTQCFDLLSDLQYVQRGEVSAERRHRLGVVIQRLQKRCKRRVLKYSLLSWN